MYFSSIDSFTIINTHHMTNGELILSYIFAYDKSKVFVTYDII